MSKINRYQREFNDDLNQTDNLIREARAKYGDQAVNDALDAVYYIIPPNMIFVTCPRCQTQVGIDYIFFHLREHYGAHPCMYEGCYGRRFLTYRGYLQHRRLAHSKPSFPGGTHE